METTKMILFAIFLCSNLCQIGSCFTTEDMELFDLVENTPQNFYDLMGVNEKASASDIRKAYRKLSTLYHPDKNKESNAEERFRTIAAVAEVLRNEERRKMYDLVLKTGLPDWRAPIYYYRRVRNMGLLEMCIFLLGLSTLGQYLFAWSSYLEKKYEIEEVVLSKIRRKAKHQRKGKSAKIEEEALVSEVMSDLQKPRCQDLFPVVLFYFIISLIKSSPSYVASCREFLKSRKVEEEEEEVEPTPNQRVKVRKSVKPKIPDFADIPSYEETLNNSTPVIPNGNAIEEKKIQKWCFETLTEHQMIEFKKALKKFPNGTLQRWEKVAFFLGCSVNEVVSMVKLYKNQQFSNGVPASLQGVTGTEKENFGSEMYEEKDSINKINENVVKERKPNSPNTSNNINGYSSDQHTSCAATESDKFWKQEEQKSLELALQKFPKDTPARWDKISDFVSTKTKEECIERYKILAQQVRMKKSKGL